MGGNGSKSWQELSGSNNWDGLLDPLDDDLRKYIIHYGEGAHAIMDAFNAEETSEAYGFSRYPMPDFFTNVGLPWYQYDVTQFFYAAEAIIFPLWVGYVAVANDEGKKSLGRRDILVVWRATSSIVEKFLDLDDTLVSASDIFGRDDVMVHEGFHKLYTASNFLNDYTKLSARDQALKEVQKQLDLHKDEDLSITVVGHSLGAALATLNAVDIAANGYNYPAGQPDKACPVTAFPFASPRVGDEKFKELYDELNRDKNLHALRIFNAIDIVPNLPPVNYVHVGEQLMVDTRKSPYLKPIYIAGLSSLGTAHLLEPILHVVAGWNGGTDGGFDLKDNRDISLVNKQIDALDSQYKVPAAWWNVRNKGMILTVENGTPKWALNDYKPPPPTF